MTVDNYYSLSDLPHSRVWASLLWPASQSSVREFVLTCLTVECDRVCSDLPHSRVWASLLWPASQSSASEFGLTCLAVECERVCSDLPHSRVWASLYGPASQSSVSEFLYSGNVGTSASRRRSMLLGCFHSHSRPPEASNIRIPSILQIFLCTLTAFRANVPDIKLTVTSESKQ